MPSSSSATEGMMWIRLRSYAFDFSNCDHRQKAHEDQEQRHEQSECSRESPDIDPGRFKISPIRRDVIAVQRSDDDHETLKPHADVHKDRDDEDNHHARPNFLEPKQLRADDVATDHRPISPPIRRSEEHTSEFQSRFGISYAVF